MRFWRRYRPARAVKTVSPIRPRLEVLEDRCVPNVDMVTNLSGSGSTVGSLPYEVAHAAPGDTIAFAPTLKGGTIFLNNTLDINQNLTIDGASNGITVNIMGSQRVVEIEAGKTVAVNGLTITGGVAPPGFNGGGVFNLGSLVLTNSEPSVRQAERRPHMLLSHTALVGANRGRTWRKFPCIPASCWRRGRVRLRVQACAQKRRVPHQRAAFQAHRPRAGWPEPFALVPRDQGFRRTYSRRKD